MEFALWCVAAIAKELNDFPDGESGWCDDGGFFGECSEGEEKCDEELFFGRGFAGWIEVEGKSPEREGCGEDVGVGESALCEPDWVDRSEDDSDGGDCGAG